MNRSIRRKVVSRERDEQDSLGFLEKETTDWTKLSDDIVIQLFSCLSIRDRASLSSTCKTWRVLGNSWCLWQTLDLLAHKCDWNTASLLAARCTNLQKLWFRGAESAEAIINLRAASLREISIDSCTNLTNSTLSAIAARHECLESLQLGLDFSDGITSDVVKAIALCCPKLRKLSISGIQEVNGIAIEALAKHCPNLTEVGFIDCLVIDETALGDITSVCFLSVAGTTNVNWVSATNSWSKLQNLKGLDVSRTDIVPSAIVRFLSSFKSLKVLCALDCPSLEEDTSFVADHNNKGKVLLAFFSDIFKEISTLFVDSVSTNKGRDIFSYWRKHLEGKDRNMDEIVIWLEWIISRSLLRIAESNTPGLDHFWVSQGAGLLLSLTQSSQEDVQERAATSLAMFVVTDDENATIDGIRANAVMKDGGVPLLLDLARSWREGIQAEATKAIANLSVNTGVAKAVAEDGGITILAHLARSMNKSVAEEAAGGLWNLSVGEGHKIAIAEDGGIKALVDMIFKWSNDGNGVLERACGALANLAADDKCSMEIAAVGGLHALVMLACNCKQEGVQEQAARALGNLATHGDSNSNNAAVGQEAGAIEALIQLTRSGSDGVRQEAAGALWNLSFNDRNREAIASAGGVEALVALARSCSGASSGLQERAAGALWGLSVSEANSIAIGQEGGVAPLIALAQSEAEYQDVHETAAGALWNLAFNPGNALRIVEEGGVPTLVQLCSSSLSTMARFMSALALAYMFDGRMDEVAMIGSSSGSTSKSANLEGARRMALKHIDTFVQTFSDAQVFSAAAVSSAPAVLAQISESACIYEAGLLRCSGVELGRFVSMLRNPSSALKACAAFALHQLTVPGGRHALHHVGLLQNAGASRVLRSAAAAACAPLEAKVFAKIVLRNLEYHQVGPSI